MQRWTHEQHMYMNLALKAESHPHFTQCVFEKKKRNTTHVMSDWVRNVPSSGVIPAELQREHHHRPLSAPSALFSSCCPLRRKKMSVSAAVPWLHLLTLTHTVSADRLHTVGGGGVANISFASFEGGADWGWALWGIGVDLAPTCRDWRLLSEPAQRSRRTDGGGKVKIQLHRHGNVLCYPFPCRRTETERMVYPAEAGTGVWKVCCCRFTVTASKQNPDDHQTVSVNGKNNPEKENFSIWLKNDASNCLEMTSHIIWGGIKLSIYDFVQVKSKCTAFLTYLALTYWKWLQIHVLFGASSVLLGQLFMKIYANTQYNL